MPSVTGASSARHTGVNLGGTAEGLAFRPNQGREVFLFVSERTFHIRSMTMKAQLEAIRSAALEAINGTQTTAELDAVRV